MNSRQIHDQFERALGEQTMTDAARAEARRIMAVQASTAPEPDADGRRDIGPRGAWERARGVLTRPGSPFSGHLEDVPATPETTGLGQTREQPRRGGRFL